MTVKDAAPVDSKTAEAKGETAAEATSVTEEKGFPEGKPLAEMTGEQREAYWKYHARSWESKAKASPTSQELAEFRRKAKEFDRIEQEGKSELEKATDTVAQLQEKLAKYAAQDMRIEAAKKVELPLDMAEFITADDPETAEAQALKLKERLAKTVTTTVPQGYQGKGTGKGSGVTDGRELYLSKKPKPTK
jgi:vacuolar-type H+-ATPase subunit I/STV1